MKQLLARIKEKPRAVRDQYAFYGAAVVTAVIAGVWVLSFSADDGLLATQRADNEPSTQAQEKSAPAFGSLFSQMKEQWANVRSSLERASSSAATSTEEGENDLEATVERSLQQPPSTTTEQAPPPQPEPSVRFGRIGTSSSQRATTTPTIE